MSMNGKKGAHELQQEISRAEQDGLEGKGSERSTYDPRFRCAALISNRKSITFQAPGFRHADPGLSENNPASTQDEAKWLHRQTHVYL